MKARDVAQEAADEGWDHQAVQVAMLVSIADSLERIAGSLQAMETATVSTAKKAP